MKRFSAWASPVFFLVTLLLSVSLKAQGLSTEQANKFLNDSGLNELIASLPGSMQQHLDVSRLSSHSAADVDKTSQAIAEALQRVDGHSIALIYLKTDKRAEELDATLKFLSSPLGQRVSKEERLASQPEAQAEMQAFIQELMSKPVDPKRAALLEDLFVSLNADKVVMQLMKGVYFSVLNAVQVINPAQSVVLGSQMEKEWAAMSPILSEQFSKFMLLSANYSYRNLSDEDISAYINFLKSEPGQVYWRVGLDIVDLYIQGFVSELVAGLSGRS